MPSVGWWILGWDAARFLLALAIAAGLVAAPLAAWALMWKASSLTQRDDGSVYLLQQENEQLDRLLQREEKNGVL